MYLQTVAILTIAISLIGIGVANAQTLFTTKHFACTEKSGAVVCLPKAGLAKSDVVTFTTKHFVCVSVGGKAFTCTHK